MAEINFQDLSIEQEINQDKIPNDSPVADRFNTSVEITFYCNRAEPNRIDKTNYLTDGQGGEQFKVYQGTFKDEVDLINPTLYINTQDPLVYNYMSLSIMNKMRYYFVNNVTIVRRGLIRIECSLDVLMTYKDAILNCDAFVDRNEFTFNRMIVDSNRVVEQGQNVFSTYVDNEVFNIGDYSLCATFLAGNKDEVE